MMEFTKIGAETLDGGSGPVEIVVNVGRDEEGSLFGRDKQRPAIISCLLPPSSWKSKALFLAGRWS